jgi:MFS transporter, DHA1 family, tetracycline resistance protein
MPDPAIPTVAPEMHEPVHVTAPSRKGRSAMFIVFLVVVIDLLGFGLVLPLLPRFADDYVEPVLGLPPKPPKPAKAERGAKVEGQTPRTDPRLGAIIGFLMASFSAAQFFAAPIWGRVSDRIGRRPILLVGLGGSVVFYALFGYAAHLPATAEWGLLALILLFIARTGAGICGATIATAQAVIADCTPPERRKHGMAMIGAAFGIGFTFGPLVGYAALLSGEQAAVGYVASALSAVALVLGILLLPETRQFGTTPPMRRGWIDFRAVRYALSSPAIGPIILVFFLSSLGFGSFESTLSVLLEDGLGLDKNTTFLVFAYVGFVLALAQGGLYRPLAKWVSEPTFMATGILLMALGLIALGGATYAALNDLLGFGLLLAAFMVSLALSVIGFALLTPSAQALISRRTDDDRQGEILGVNQSASALARILGPIFGLMLYYLSSTRLLPYAFGAGLLLLMLPLIPRIRRG